MAFRQLSAPDGGPVRRPLHRAESTLEHDQRGILSALQYSPYAGLRTEGNFIFNIFNDLEEEEKQETIKVGEEIKRVLYGDESPQENHAYIGSFVWGDRALKKIFPSWRMCGADGCILLFSQESFSRIVSSTNLVETLRQTAQNKSGSRPILAEAPKQTERSELESRPILPEAPNRQSKANTLEKQPLYRVLYGKRG